MKKPFVVFENDKVKFTDLGNGTTEILSKNDDSKIIVTNAAIRAELLAMKAKETPLNLITAYKYRGN